MRLNVSSVLPLTHSGIRHSRHRVDATLGPMTGWAFGVRTPTQGTDVMPYALAAVAELMVVDQPLIGPRIATECVLNQIVKIDVATPQRSPVSVITPVSPRVPWAPSRFPRQSR